MIVYMYKKEIKKQLTVRNIIAGLIIVILVLFLIIGVSTKVNNKKRGKLVTSSTLTDAINISELSASQFTYNGIAEIYKDKDKKKIECCIRYNSKIKAGIDMTKVKWEINKEKKTIKPILPEIMITVNTVDEKSLSFLPEDAPVELKTALIACKKDAEKESEESGELKSVAEENIQSVIEGLLYPILEPQGYMVVGK